MPARLCAGEAMETETTTWDRIRDILDDHDTETLDGYLNSLTGSEVIRAFFRLDEDEQTKLLVSLSPSTAAEIIDDVPDAVAADLLEHMPSEDAATIIEELPSDEQADVLSEIEEDELDSILNAMEPKHAADARELLGFAPDTAGGLMIQEYLEFRTTTITGEVLNKISSLDADLSRYILHHVYITTPRGLLLGTVPFRKLLNTDRNVELRNVMGRPQVVNANADLDVLESCFDESEATDIPVTTDTGLLLGVARRSDVEEALNNKEAGDHLKSQGIVAGEELRSMPVHERSRRRLSWLSINIVLNILAASVIAMFEDTLTAVIALAVFLPIVSDMSGCSGNQAVAVSMRELTLGIVNPRDVLRVWWQEVRVGLINGITLGIMLGLAAWLWKGNLALSLVVTIALNLNTVIAVSIGGTVPLLLKRYGVDPAVASGPILTTITDICGFALVLSVATLALPWM